MKSASTLFALLFCLIWARTAAAQPVAVTADNFIRAETDRTYASFVKQGALGKFEHFRELAPIDDQHVQRGNRDTLYSMGVSTSMPDRSRSRFPMPAAAS